MDLVSLLSPARLGQPEEAQVVSLVVSRSVNPKGAPGGISDVMLYNFFASLLYSLLFLSFYLSRIVDFCILSISTREYVCITDVCR